MDCTSVSSCGQRNKASVKSVCTECVNSHFLANARTTKNLPGPKCTAAVFLEFISPLVAKNQIGVVSKQLPGSPPLQLPDPLLLFCASFWPGCLLNHEATWPVPHFLLNVKAHLANPSKTLLCWLSSLWDSYRTLWALNLIIGTERNEWIPRICCLR